MYIVMLSITLFKGSIELEKAQIMSKYCISRICKKWPQPKSASSQTKITDQRLFKIRFLKTIIIQEASELIEVSKLCKNNSPYSSPVAVPVTILTNVDNVSILIHQ